MALLVAGRCPPTATTMGVPASRQSSGNLRRKRRRAQQSADKQKARRLRRNGQGERADGAANSGVADPSSSSDGGVAEDADMGYGGGTDASDSDDGGGESADTSVCDKATTC